MSITTLNIDGLNTTLKDKDYQDAYNTELVYTLARCRVTCRCLQTSCSQQRGKAASLVCYSLSYTHWVRIYVNQ